MTSFVDGQGSYRTLSERGDGDSASGSRTSMKEQHDRQSNGEKTQLNAQSSPLDNGIQIHHLKNSSSPLIVLEGGEEVSESTT